MHLLFNMSALLHIWQVTINDGMALNRCWWCQAAKSVSTNTRHRRSFLFLEIFLIFQEEYQWQDDTLQINNTDNF